MRGKIGVEKIRKRVARRNRVRGRMESSDRARLTVYRSAKHIYALLVDPASGRTITTVSTRTQGVLGPDVSSGGLEAAKRVGAAVAEAAKKNRIEEVVFNRNGFRYHGRVKALADSAREAGLRF
jgi:large subunit ribosomal protein L18